MHARRANGTSYLNGKESGECKERKFERVLFLGQELNLLS